MKKMIKKVIAPVLVITVLFAVLRPFCIQDGKCNYFLLLLLMGIPFGIGKMCVWMVPRGFDLGGMLACGRTGVKHGNSDPGCKCVEFQH